MLLPSWCLASMAMCVRQVAQSGGRGRVQVRITGIIAQGGQLIGEQLAVGRINGCQRRAMA